MDGDHPTLLYPSEQVSLSLRQPCKPEPCTCFVMMKVTAAAAAESSANEVAQYTGLHRVETGPTSTRILTLCVIQVDMRCGTSSAEPGVWFPISTPHLPHPRTPIPDPSLWNSRKQQDINDEQASSTTNKPLCS